MSFSLLSLLQIIHGNPLKKKIDDKLVVIGCMDIRFFIMQQFLNLIFLLIFFAETSSITSHMVSPVTGCDIRFIDRSYHLITNNFCFSSMLWWRWDLWKDFRYNSCMCGKRMYFQRITNTTRYFRYEGLHCNLQTVIKL